MVIRSNNSRVGLSSSHSGAANQRKKSIRKGVPPKTVTSTANPGFSILDSKALRILAAVIAISLIGMLASRVFQHSSSLTRHLSAIPAISTNSIGSDSSIISRMKNILLTQNANATQTSDILVTAYTKSEHVPTGWKLIRKIQRPNTYFTQGLAFRGEELFESTGMYRESGIFVVSLKNETYTVLDKKLIDRSLFGEGLVLWPPYLEREQSTIALPRFVTGSRHEFTEKNRLLSSEADSSLALSGLPGTAEQSEVAAHGINTMPKGGNGSRGTSFDDMLTKEMIVQLTWREGIVQILDPVTLDVTDQLAFQSTNSEGWGITTDGLGAFVQSDGSSFLHFWSTDLNSAQSSKTIPNNDEGVHFVHIPALVGKSSLAQISFSRAGNTGSKVRVIDAVNPRDPKLRAKVSRSRKGRDLPGVGSQQGALNELEFIHGWVFSNIWYDNHVAIIHPGTGQVVWYLDFTQLVLENTRYPSDCLNGLAYTMRLDIAESDGAEPIIASEPWKGRLWVTGKYWSNIYEIELTDLVLATELIDPAI